MGNRNQHRLLVRPLWHSPHQKQLLVDVVVVLVVELLIVEEVMEVEEVCVADVELGAEAHTDAAWNMGTGG